MANPELCLFVDKDMSDDEALCLYLFPIEGLAVFCALGRTIQFNLRIFLI